MIKLSIAIITLNEEKNIIGCLESIKDVADEIIVVDSYSTDKTREICESYGAKVIENKFEGYIQQRNFAVDQAKYDHVLSLDADERLSKELIASVKKAKQNFIADAYYFNRLNNYCGKWIKHSGWYPDKKLRMWDRRKGRLGGQNPHDRLIMQPGSKIKKLKGDLLHYTYYTIQQHIDQSVKFTHIGAKAAFLKGKKASILKIVIYPSWRFFRDYFLNLGFLDGYYGLIICTISAHFTFLKYVKIRELSHNSLAHN